MQVNQDHVCLRDGSHLGVCAKINIWTPLAGPERSPGQMLIVITLEKLSEWSKQRRIYNINTRRLRRKTRIRNHLLKCCPFFVNEEHLHRKGSTCVWLRCGIHCESSSPGNSNVSMCQVYSSSNSGKTSAQVSQPFCPDI